MSLNRDITSLEDLVYMSRDMKSRGVTDLKEIKSNLIFPFVEILGYDTTEPSQFINCQVFDLTAEESFDFELTRDPNKYRTNTVLKIVDSEEMVSQHKQLVQDAFNLYKAIKFAIITDGFKYCIYEASGQDVDYSKITIKPLKIIDLCNLDEEDEGLLRLLSKDQAKIRSQKGVDVRGLFSDDNDNESNIGEIKDKENLVKKHLPKLVIGAVIVLLLLLAAIFLRPAKNKDIPDLLIEEVNIPDNGNPKAPTLNDSTNKGVVLDTSLQYINIKNILELNVYQPNNVLQAHLMSDIVEGGIIKFEIYCGSNKVIAYGVTDKNGQSVVEYNIPADWSDPEIKVTASLRFDEADYPQPKSITKLYGESGEYIVQKPDFPIYGLVQNKTKHSNASVKAYLENYNLNKQLKLSREAGEDFLDTERMIDPFNNLKIVPKGYSLTQANIGENRFIYPQIFVDGKTNKAYFYIIVGHMGRDLINMRAASFNANGHRWGYEVGANQTGTTVTGGLAAEWVYFNQYDTPKLMNDMRLLANANEQSVAIAGHRRKEHELTEEERYNLKYFLYLFDKYFQDEDLFTIEMFSDESLGEVSLDHFKKPNRVLVRTSNEEAQINELKTEVGKGGANKEELVKKLDIMENSYRLLKGEFITSIHNEVVNSKGLPDYKYDTSNKSYLRLILDYSEKGLSEQGFFPEIIVYSDGTFHIPLRSSNLNEGSAKPPLAKSSISQNLFSNIVNSIEKTSHLTIKR